MPSPVTPVLDAFARSVVGPFWRDYGGGTTISSNQLSVGSGEAPNWAQPFDPNQEAYFTFISQSAGGFSLGVCGTLYEYYCLNCTPDGTVNGSEIVYGLMGVSETRIGAAFTMSLSANDVVWLRRNGNDLELYVNGTLTQTRTDSTYVGGGLIGLYSGGGTLVVDDFGGGSTTAGTINYIRRPWVRPTGVAQLPLVLRNPQNDNTRKDYLKDGPSPVVKVGPGDYRTWFEGLTDQTGGLTNYFFSATSPDGWTWTKSGDNAAMDPNASPNWEQGEICPDWWFWNPGAGAYWMYYHGGNNSGPRQIGLMTSPTGLVGSWTRANSGNPVLANGGSGDFDEDGVADCVVFRLSASDWRMLYKGFRASDGKAQTGYATSTDGISWTKSGSNPVLPLGIVDEADGAYGGWPYVDGTGRIHYWYCGLAGSVQTILYAFSDDWTTWARDHSDVICEGQGATDSDLEVGDVVRGVLDDGLICLTCMNFNAAGYTGDALGRLEGRGQYWIPEQVTAQPTRSARATIVTTGTRRPHLKLPDAVGGLLNQSSWTIWCDFRCPPGNACRPFYVEYADFNTQLLLGLDTDGTFGTASGRQATWVRTNTATVEFAGATTRYDDNQWHRVRFRRNSAASFDVYVDGVLEASSTTNPSTDATALAFVNALGVEETDLVEFPLSGPGGETYGWGGTVMRRLVVLAGHAMSDAEELALWNSGNAGGTTPGSGTLHLDLLLGDGGILGPDIDDSGNAHACEVVHATLIDPAPRAVAQAMLGVALLDSLTLSARRLIQ